MKIRGYLEDHLFYLRTLTVCTVLSTGLLIYNQVNNTSGANTSGKNATLEESIFGKKENQKELNVESLQRVTGSGIMGHVQNSRTTSKNSVRRILVEPYSPSMGHLEGSTMKKHDNSFFMTF